MKITDLLGTGAVLVGAQASSRSELIDQLVAQLAETGAVQDVSAMAQAVVEREEVFSTAVGDGLALPHAQSVAASQLALVAATTQVGVGWDAPDGQPVDLVFLVCAPLAERTDHLELLGKVSALLARAETVQRLRAATTAEEFLEAVAAAEAQGASGTRNVLVPEEAQPTKEEPTAPDEAEAIEVQGLRKEPARNSLAKRFAAVGARIGHREARRPSPTSAAHFPVPRTEDDASADQPEGASRAEADAERRKRLYHHIRAGIVPALPFIVAGGLLTTIAFALDGPGAGTAAFGFFAPHAAFFKKIAEEALSMLLPVLSGFIAFSIADRPGLAPGVVGGLLVREGYSLDFLNSAPNLDASLNVSSGYLGALVAGFVAGYLMQLIKRLCDLLPDSFEGIKPVLLYPVLGMLGTGIVVFLLSPVVTWVHSLLELYLVGMGGTNAILLGTVLAGLMAIDLGGPFNSAAYAFGTTLLATKTAGSEQAMACILLGGMVPPLVVAVSSTLLARRKYSPETFRFGLVDYVLGLSFVTEGAVPFAATDLPSVVTSCVLGSLVAGATASTFGCSTTATTGGMFALPMVTKPGPFVFSLVLGVAVGAVLLAFLRRPRERHMAM